MKRIVSLTEIHAIEVRVAQSRANTLTELRRANVALRSLLARPTTLAMVAGAAGVVGFWLTRRPASSKASPDAADVTSRPSAAGVFLAVIVKYGMQAFPFILQNFLAMREQSPEHAKVAVAKDPPLQEACEI